MCPRLEPQQYFDAECCSGIANRAVARVSCMSVCKMRPRPKPQHQFEVACCNGIANVGMDLNLCITFVSCPTSSEKWQMSSNTWQVARFGPVTIFGCGVSLSSCIIRAGNWRFAWWTLCLKLLLNQIWTTYKQILFECSTMRPSAWRLSSDFDAQHCWTETERGTQIPWDVYKSY